MIIKISTVIRVAGRNFRALQKITVQYLQTLNTKNVYYKVIPIFFQNALTNFFMYVQFFINQTSWARYKKLQRPSRRP